MNKAVFSFLAGVFATLVVVTGFAVYVRFNALKTAWQYPQVVESLKVQTKMAVK